MELVHSEASLVHPATPNRLSRGWVGLAAVGASLWWLAIAVTLAAFLLNALTSLAAEVIFLGALVVLMLSGVLDTSTALAGFSNPGMSTVAVLYIVVAGLQQTGGLDMVSRTVLGMPPGQTQALIRLIVPVVSLSAFLNNIPIDLTSKKWIFPKSRQ